ncbi:hypothetical protein AGMMS49525_08940 [Bacteroidia bacterium]|nr:hypothetical protein AGMMS49525_08940 [Bacteroidia bacterium]
MKYFLIAGEASGDLHASNLMRELNAQDSQADFHYFGGDLMQAVGGTLLKHYRNMAYMGFIPVLMHLPQIFANAKLCKQSIRDYQPDVVIFVDYPGFNLPMAKFVQAELHIPTLYYISPKIWAWKSYRVKDIKKYVDKMLCILPFEVDFYKKYDYKVDYVGNPTVDAIAARDHQDEAFETFCNANSLSNKPIIALLAGSRKQEIKDNLPTMLAAAAAFPDYQSVIAGAPGIDANYYEQFARHVDRPRAESRGSGDTPSPIAIVFNQTYRLLQQSHAALVTSGTATLETALLRTPQAVCYKTPTAIKHLVTWVWKHLFKCKYISLVNLIANKTVVKELFGNTFSTDKVRHELGLLLNDNSYRQAMAKNYDDVIAKLGTVGASEKAAKIISSYQLPVTSYRLAVSNYQGKFHFKQFAIQHDLCAMKVGTDGVLLAAWTPPLEEGAGGRLLDLGCGSGLIALMLTQKTHPDDVTIDAIDIDENAYNQAIINFNNAPFKTKPNAIHGDFRTFAPEEKYDLIVSNPPFFVDSLPSPDAGRTTARHTNTLPFSDLMQHSAELLTENGRLSLILPFDAFDVIQSLAEENNLTLTRKTAVKPKNDALPNRILLEYTKQLPVTSYQLPVTGCRLPVGDELSIRTAQGDFSAEYIALTKDFYLNFPE